MIADFVHLSTNYPTVLLKCSPELVIQNNPNMAYLCCWMFVGV